jgi:hypothetical protein
MLYMLRDLQAFIQAISFIYDKYTLSCYKIKWVSHAYFGTGPTVLLFCWCEINLLVLLFSNFVVRSTSLQNFTKISTIISGSLLQTYQH